MTSLLLRDVEVGYGSRPVVSGVSFDLDAGQWLGLIGPNGAGKSSLLKGVMGLIETVGRIDIGGRQLEGRARARAVAYLPQRPLLPPGMTVAEYVLLGRTAHLPWLSAESKHDRRAATDAMVRLDVDRFAHRFVTDLSGGEAQRVALARSLAQEAPLVLLDEPTSALDLGHQIGVLELVDELRCERGLTVVAAMHDLTSAGRFADQLLLLGRGRTLALGRPDEVLTEKALGDAYGTEVTLLTAPDGSLVVVPDRQPTTI